MFGFRKKGGLQQLEENTRNSFEAVRQDTQNVYEWLNYLNQQNLHLQEVLDEKTRLLEQMPKSKEEVRQLIDAHFSMEPVLDRIRHVEHRVDSLARMAHKIEVVEGQQKDVFAELRALHSQVQNLGTHRRQTVIPKIVPELSFGTTPLQKKVAKMAIRNSKEMIKQSILKLVKMHAQMSGVALRESIVEEQGLCSKSSFYRLLDELEKEGQLVVVSEGKEKRYYWGSSDLTKSTRNTTGI